MVLFSTVLGCSGYQTKVSPYCNCISEIGVCDCTSICVCVNIFNIPILNFPYSFKANLKMQFCLDDKQSSLGKTCESGLWGLTVFCINMKCFHFLYTRFIVYKVIYSVEFQECPALSGAIFTAEWRYRCFAPSFSHTFWQGVVLQHCWQAPKQVHEGME